MGMILTAGKYSIMQRNSLQKPLVFCNPDKEFINAAISINIELAKRLVAINQNRRTMRMEQCFQQVLNDLPDKVVIKDFDVMFNPEYKIDVLRIMISSAKIKPFSIIWPGCFEDGKLIYAEEGFADHKVFDISQYDITCII